MMGGMGKSADGGGAAGRTLCLPEPTGPSPVGGRHA